MITWLLNVLRERDCLDRRAFATISRAVVRCHRALGHPGRHRCDARDGWPVYDERLVYEWSREP